jgi:hypothetical protein
MGCVDDSGDAQFMTSLLRRLGADTGYLLLSFPLAIASFTLLVTGLSVGTGLLVTLVGFAVLLATMYVARGFAAVEA